MHPEAYAGFGWAIEKSGLDPTAPLRVLDVGGQNVNGTVHEYFTHPETTILTLDLENADIIADACTWQPDRQFDVVMATEVFEHVKDWKAVIQTMRRALEPDGVLLATCASDNRQPHGATGAPAPGPREWYGNVSPEQLRRALHQHFRMAEVTYLYPPGDAYMWARPVALEEVTVIVPTIPTRAKYRAEAVASVWSQTLQPFTVIVEPDINRQGPAAVRNRALEKVETDWVAFLDDDDWLLPHHLATLMTAAVQHRADMVWPWFTVVGGTDPFPQHRGRQWNPTDPHQIPITVLARTEALRSVGGFQRIGEGPTDADGNRAGEDWDLWLRLSAAGFKFHHVPETTWVWRHHPHNTSGLPTRW